MGQVEDRWWSTTSGERVRRERFGRGLRWRARYRDAEGRQRSRSFARKPDAVRFLTLVQADLLRGSYIDPGRSRTPLSDYAGIWLESWSVRPTTRRTYDSHLRTWILPALGGRSLASITPTDVRVLLRQLTEHLAPSTSRHVHGLLSTILRSAVEDGYLARNPAARTGPRRTPRPLVAPLTVGQVQALIDATPERFRVVVLLGAGCGLRIGEALGLRVGEVDLEAGVLRVSAQLQALPGQPLALRPPKTYSSIRTLPLPETVAAAVAEHLRRWPPAASDAQDALLVRTVTGRPVWPRTFHSRIWRTATTGAGLPGVRFHQLRHFYASALIRAGESVKTVQAALGHASAVETLHVYVGLWPDNDKRTRAAIDGLGLARPAAAPAQDTRLIG
jgi:integrase